MRPAIWVSVILMVLALALAYMAGVRQDHWGALALILSGVVGLLSLGVLGADSYHDGLTTGQENKEEEQ